MTYDCLLPLGSDNLYFDKAQARRLFQKYADKLSSKHCPLPSKEREDQLEVEKLIDLYRHQRKLSWDILELLIDTKSDPLNDYYSVAGPVLTAISLPDSGFVVDILNLLIFIFLIVH